MTPHSINFPLCSAWNHYDPVNIKWKGDQEQLSGNVYNLGKMRGWEKLLKFLFLFRWSLFRAFFLTSLWSQLYLPAYFLPRPCQWTQLRSCQVMTFRCRTLWGSGTEKRRFKKKKKGWFKVNEAGPGLTSGGFISTLIQKLMPWGGMDRWWVKGGYFEEEAWRVDSWPSVEH